MTEPPLISWQYLAPYIGFIAIPYLTHTYATFRERQARLHSIISELQKSFDDINELFFESVESEKNTLQDKVKDAIREQKIIIHLNNINLICKRSALILKNTDEKFHQKEVSTIRRIATNDQRRTEKCLIESSRKLSDAQNTITNILITSPTKGIFNTFK